MRKKVEFMCHHIEEWNFPNAALADEFIEKAKGHLCMTCTKDYDEVHGDNGKNDSYFNLMNDLLDKTKGGDE